jgi:hypothetical protein
MCLAFAVSAWQAGFIAENFFQATTNKWSRNELCLFRQ